MASHDGPVSLPDGLATIAMLPPPVFAVPATIAATGPANGAHLPAGPPGPEVETVVLLI
jgi:hypothetical protein